MADLWIEPEDIETMTQQNSSTVAQGPAFLNWGKDCVTLPSWLDMLTGHLVQLSC